MEWISVKDRLPEYRQEVITSRLNRYGERQQGVYHFWGDTNDWVWNDVTHWCPLPEPPEVK